MTLLVYNAACIGDKYAVTFITCQLLDSLYQYIPFSSCTLDICPTNCMFLEDLIAFINCTPPYIDYKELLIQDHLYGRLQAVFLNSPCGATLVYAEVVLLSNSP